MQAETSAIVVPTISPSTSPNSTANLTLSSTQEYVGATRASFTAAKKRTFVRDFAVEQSFLGEHSFVSSKIEDDYRVWSMTTMTKEAMAGIDTVLIFLVCLVLIDFILWMMSKDKMFVGDSGLPRICLMFGGFLGVFYAIKRYFSGPTLEEYYTNGWDTTRPFLVVYAFFIAYTSWFIFAVMGKSAPIFDVIPTIESDRFAVIYATRFVQYMHNLTETYADPSGAGLTEIPLTEIAPLAHAMILMPQNLSIVLFAMFQQTFSRLCRFGQKQLTFLTAFQTIPILRVLASGYYSADAVIGMTIFYLTCIVLPMYRLNLENMQFEITSRSEYVHWKQQQISNEALEASLREATNHLNELNEKIQFTKEQENVIKKGTEELMGLTSYKIDLEQELEFSKKLGEGAFGIVYLAKFRGETVAVKQLLSTAVDEDSVARFKFEILLLTRLHHPNITQILGAAWTAPHLAIVLEYAENGDLSCYLKKHMEKCNWRNGRLKFLKNIAHGMRYLHNRDPPVMHRDLKTENCLITSWLGLKLSDFGESRETIKNNELENLTQVGTPFFVAPEVFRGDFYTESCDVFSFALVLGCLGIADGSVIKLFSSDMRMGRQLSVSDKQKINPNHIAMGHQTGWRADLGDLDWPQKMKKLVTDAWKDDPKVRPGFNEICEELEKWSFADFGEEGREQEASGKLTVVSVNGQRRRSTDQREGGETRGVEEV